MRSAKCELRCGNCGVRTANCGVPTANCGVRICRQSIKSPSEFHAWSVHGNYCREGTTDRRLSAMVELMTTIIAINGSTSILQGAVDTLTA